MTQEHSATLLKGLCLVALFAAVITGGWYSSLSGKNSVPKTPNNTGENGPANSAPDPDEPRPVVHIRIPNDITNEQLDAILKSIVSPENGLAIVHFHLPGDSESEQLADILNHVRNKYGRRVLVVRLGCEGFPPALKSHGITKLPHIVMIVGTKKVFEFQGLWSQQRVEQKVDDILHGLVKRIGKEWRPAVPGMTPAGK